ncbi:MAG TPA: magnesium/cobalt transporter CorA [Planctomycetota bacterium]|nr:magnesium/cobalt transporter CorA [Planctomycetota bacterium]
MKTRRIHKLHPRKRRAEPGASPGTLTLSGESRKPSLSVISYNRETLEEQTLTGPAEIRRFLDMPDRVTWLAVRGLGDEHVLRELADIFHIHPLALEDVVHSPQRPKVDEYDDHRFIIARMVILKSADDMHAEQISIFLGKNYVLTFMEDVPDCLDPVRNRLRKQGGLHRTHGADYLCYSILDAIIDNYFPVLEAYGEYLETLEDQTVLKPTRRTLSAIHTAKRELLDLRRVIWPQRDTINSLIRDESPLISAPVKVFLRDCHDHAVQVMDMVETYREITSGLHDVYLSSIGNRTNEIMRVLTIISTIFIPLTFIAGVYGMNFKTEASPYNMPELTWYFGYPLCLLLMLLIALSLLYFFKRKGWLFGASERAEPGMLRSIGLPNNSEEK